MVCNVEMKHKANHKCICEWLQPGTPGRCFCYMSLQQEQEISAADSGAASDNLHVWMRWRDFEADEAHKHARTGVGHRKTIKPRDERVARGVCGLASS